MATEVLSKQEAFEQQERETVAAMDAAFAKRAAAGLRTDAITCGQGSASCAVHVYRAIERASIDATLDDLRAFLRGEDVPYIRVALEATGLVEQQTGFCTRCHMTVAIGEMHPRSGYCLGCTLPEDLELDRDPELDRLFGTEAPHDRG